MTKVSPAELQTAINGWIGGTNQWYRHMLVCACLYTDGVKTFAELAGGYWLIDIMATELFALQKKHDFLHVVLKVKGSSADLIADDGNGNVLYTKKIEFTDCPEGEWRFYFTDNVILTPGEY